MWSSNDFLATKPFTFFLGAEAKPIVVQGGLFKDISKPLHARIPQVQDDESGTWQLESDTITDVEWNVFAGLVEYAYTGDYARSIPLPLANIENICPDDHSASGKQYVYEIEVQSDQDDTLKEGFDSWGSLPSRKSKGRRKREPSPEEPILSKSLWQKFTDGKPAAGKNRVSNELSLSSQNTAALLYHAKLCVLANRYMVDDLQHLCLTKLHYALRHFEVLPQKIDSFLDLVEYVYVEEGVQGIPELKEIVLLFTAAKLNILRQDPRLRCMLEAVGNLGADIVYEISKAENWR